MIETLVCRVHFWPSSNPNVRRQPSCNSFSQSIFAGNAAKAQQIHIWTMLTRPPHTLRHWHGFGRVMAKIADSALSTLALPWMAVATVLNSWAATHPLQSQRLGLMDLATLLILITSVQVHCQQHNSCPDCCVDNYEGITLGNVNATAFTEPIQTIFKVPDLHQYWVMNAYLHRKLHWIHSRTRYGHRLCSTSPLWLSMPHKSSITPPSRCSASTLMCTLVLPATTIIMLLLCLWLCILQPNADPPVSWQTFKPQSRLLDIQLHFLVLRSMLHHFQVRAGLQRRLLLLLLPPPPPPQLPPGSTWSLLFVLLAFWSAL